MTSHDISKLPQWAQEQILKLKGDYDRVLNHRDRLVAEFEGRFQHGGRIYKRDWVGNEHIEFVIAQDFDDIRFRLPPANEANRRDPVKREIEVRFCGKGTDDGKREYLELSTDDGRLIIIPDGTNRCRVDVKGMFA